MSILARSFNDRLIRIRQSDRYVSGTDMAQACGKRYHDWARLAAYANALRETYAVDVESASVCIFYRDSDPDVQYLTYLNRSIRTF